jgi:hypothetical protein
MFGYKGDNDLSRDVDQSNLQSHSFQTNGGFASFAGPDSFGPQDIVIDSATGRVGLPRPEQADLSTNPLQRFYNSEPKEISWHPSGLGDVSSWQTANGHTAGRPPYDGYREAAPGSNPESHITGGQRDSGYHTGRGNGTRYTESMRDCSEDNASLLDVYRNFTIGGDQRTGSGTQQTYYEPAKYTNQYRQQQTPNLTCLIPGCKSFQKQMNASDHKYVHCTRVVWVNRRC